MIKAINKSLKNKRGFTLIELIVVLAVLAIIAAIAIPRFSAVQQHAKVEADAASIEMVEKAAELYFVTTSHDHNDDITGADLVNADYLKAVPKQQNGNGITMAIEFDADGNATASWN